MAKLQPWYKVVPPREDLREGRPLDASEFAVHLDHIRDNRAPKDYQDPERFFERTFLAKNLKHLAAQTVRRLSGIAVETSAVFNMATQFGGGKTHSELALYHLFSGTAIGELPGAEELVKEIPGAVVPQQFKNPYNSQTHYETTAPEIWEQMEGRIDAVVIGAGSGGTFTGITLRR